MATSNMSRLDEITQACVEQIIDNWNEWSDDAAIAANSAQDEKAWYDHMFAALWHIVKAAVEEASND